MAPSPCARCKVNRALILRPKNHQRLCKPCFIATFEAEIHHTITTNNLFQRGERIAIGASGGKDSTVLASVLKTLNERHDYGLELILLSIDEGIKGYRDDSLETVKRNAVQYGMELCIIGYDELYGWTMDQVVEQVGKKGNCTYCGVFRRQALDRGAAKLGVRHVVTGHNADDVAETVLMNLLRGDLPRLSRSTSIITSMPSAIAPPKASGPGTSGVIGKNTNHGITDVRRSKPLKYAYEKEIVLYAHHKNLDYFSTECIYSPEAFRGSARTLIKNLEKIRPSSILDVVRSGEDMARLVPGNEDAKRCEGACKSTRSNLPSAEEEEEGAGGCGTSGRSTGGEMAAMEAKLLHNDVASAQVLETEITLPARPRPRNGQAHDRHAHTPFTNEPPSAATSSGGQRHDRIDDDTTPTTPRPKSPTKKRSTTHTLPHPPKTQKPAQKMGQCARCGYLSSQSICKACVLLEGLNKSRPKLAIDIQLDAAEEAGRC
ncbi:Cytoplasmic tRNA 2-thiolation protein 1 [Cryomyces minteri]|uniref:Cytoplasmic tRNA 2-thiolation protein 1 n=1 Tax=Cryomyces minteri TaxID=331657 RepID=A0A4V5NHF6_9PEZI|nr:Cytoplasmic tRNA 2-thiolation protein 1 [Cryomyces minteri]